MNTIEIIGSFILKVEAGNFCELNKDHPSNGLHSHNGYEMCFVVKGKGKFVHGDEIYYLDRGDVFIANPDVSHEISVITDTDSKYTDNLCLVYYIINIVHSSAAKPPETFLESMLADFLTNHSIVSKTQTHLFAYFDFLETYISKNRINTYGFHQAVRNLAIESLLTLNGNRITDYQKQTNSNIIDQALLYIGTNLTSKMTLKDIATVSHTSVRNLQYLFKKHMDISVIDYINKRKTGIAAGYLKMNFSISDAGQ